MTTEQYIEHEVKLRIHQERFKYADEKYADKFNAIDKRFDSMDSKLNWLITIVLGSIIIPAALHMLKIM